MIDYKEIEEKIKSMSAHDIIMSMVNGLRNPKTRIDMNTFGEMRDGICFGCAATNAILHIIDANEEQVKSHVTHASIYYDPTIYDDSPLYEFEGAINLLSQGCVEAYNEFVYDLGIAEITSIPGQMLPFLDNGYTEEELKEYEKLAKYQLTNKTQ